MPGKLKYSSLKLLSKYAKHFLNFMLWNLVLYWTNAGTFCLQFYVWKRVKLI